MRILVALFTVFIACNFSGTMTSEGTDNTSTIRHDPQRIEIETDNHQTTIEHSPLLGAWTDGSTENATFDIGKDSIFYLDEMVFYSYTLKGDSLTIKYPDMSYQGIAQFSGDTLTLRDPEFGTTKYTRFKD